MSETTNIQTELKKAHQRLRKVASQAAKIINDETRIIESHNEISGDVDISRVLISGKWGELFDGIKIMLIDNDEHCTRAMCEGAGLAPLHFHKFDEKIIVVSGQVRDNLSGKIFYPGETIHHKAGEKHQPEINGTIICIWTPPLPLLDSLESIENIQECFNNICTKEWNLVK
jgi:hypothetical protein